LTSVVVDASIAVCWFTRELGTSSANQLLRQGVNFVAPSLMLAEFANTLWKKDRRGEVEPDQVQIALREIHRFVPEIVEMRQLLAPAFALARAAGHPVYDCLYVALASDRGVDFVTLDRKLVAAFRGTPEGGRVFELGEWLAKG
jgi:predicted nucleic acid-binding protein